MTEPWPVADLFRSVSASDFWSMGYHPARLHPRECVLRDPFLSYCRDMDVVNSSTGHVLLLTGRPGVGKTTAIHRIAASLSGWRLAGFYTEEIREFGQRQGFRAVTLDGFEKVMAHRNIHSSYRVGKYGVDLSVIDQLADLTLGLTSQVDCYLIDEIGKMECCSQRFIAAVRRLLTSHCLVVATIALRGGGFIAEVKQRADVEQWEVTLKSREELPERALAWLRAVRGPIPLESGHEEPVQ